MSPRVKGWVATRLPLRAGEPPVVLGLFASDYDAEGAFLPEFPSISVRVTAHGADDEVAVGVVEADGVVVGGVRNVTLVPESEESLREYADG